MDRAAGDDDWASTIALALAPANGETDEAIDAAQWATRWATGDKKSYCITLEEQIRTGAHVAWQF